MSKSKAGRVFIFMETTGKGKDAWLDDTWEVEKKILAVGLDLEGLKDERKLDHWRWSTDGKIESGK